MTACRVALAAILVSSTACGSGEESVGPPVVRYGFDVCDRCGMSIDDPRFAAVARTGGRELRFDDIGDLLADLDARGGEGVEAWVHDYEGDAWIPAESAWYVRSTDIVTPMGSAIVALADRTTAERVAGETGGVVASWAALRSGEGRSNHARTKSEQEDQRR